jgi:hypothetical protein
MKDVGIFYMAIWSILYGHLVYFTAISYILWQSGIVCIHFEIFSSLGMLCQEKSGNPAMKVLRSGWNSRAPANDMHCEKSLFSRIASFL